MQSGELTAACHGSCADELSGHAPPPLEVVPKQGEAVLARRRRREFGSGAICLRNRMHAPQGGHNSTGVAKTAESY